MNLKNWSGSKAWSAYQKHMDDCPSFANYLEEYVECSRCLGTGKMTVLTGGYQSKASCSLCGGSRTVQRVNLFFEVDSVCPQCSRPELSPKMRARCAICGGSGRIKPKAERVMI